MKKTIYKIILLFIILIMFFFYGCDATIPPNDQTPVINGAVHNLTQGIYHDAIQEAIDEANSGDIIEVSSGTYYENLLFANKNITIRSTDPSNNDIVTATIIDGDNEVVIHFTEGDTSTLEGFTIQNGEATLSGGGIYIRCCDANSLINVNIITNNSAAGGGGGIFVDETSLHITGNTIEENQAKSGGGLAICGSRFPTIANNISISNNTAVSDSGGILVSSSDQAIVENNNIINNTAGEEGGGIKITLSLYPTLSGNTIANNSANNGGGISVISITYPRIRNNIIENNASYNNGGGIAVLLHSGPVLTNNIIEENTAQGKGGGIFVSTDSGIKGYETWAGYLDRKNIPDNSLVPAEGVTRLLEGNQFLENEHGVPLDYSEGAHLYFQYFSVDVNV